MTRFNRDYFYLPTYAGFIAESFNAKSFARAKHSRISKLTNYEEIHTRVRELALRYQDSRFLFGISDMDLPSLKRFGLFLEWLEYHLQQVKVYEDFPSHAVYKYVKKDPRNLYVPRAWGEALAAYSMSTRYRPELYFNAVGKRPSSAPAAWASEFYAQFHKGKSPDMTYFQEVHRLLSEAVNSPEHRGVVRTLNASVWVATRNNMVEIYVPFN